MREFRIKLGVLVLQRFDERQKRARLAFFVADRDLRQRTFPQCRLQINVTAPSSNQSMAADTTDTKPGSETVLREQWRGLSIW